MASKPWENAGQMAVPFGHQPQSKPDWTNQEMDEDGFAITTSNTGPHQTMQMQPTAPTGPEVQLPQGQPQPQLDGFGNGSLKGGPRDYVVSYDADPDPYSQQGAAFAQANSIAAQALHQDSRAVQQDHDRWAEQQHAPAEAFDPREAFGPQLPDQDPGDGCSGSGSGSALAISPTGMRWMAALCIIVAIIIIIYLGSAIVMHCMQSRGQRRGPGSVLGQPAQGQRLFDMG